MPGSGFYTASSAASFRHAWRHGPNAFSEVRALVEDCMARYKIFAHLLVMLAYSAAKDLTEVSDVLGSGRPGWKARTTASMPGRWASSACAQGRVVGACAAPAAGVKTSAIPGLGDCFAAHLKLRRGEDWCARATTPR